MYGLARRAVLTLASARVLRTVSFLLTVLPSQVKSCYAQRFPPPPPPADWPGWVRVGLLPASHGGCNDLIVSGHATVVATLACACTSVSEDPSFRLAVWCLVVMDFCVEVYEGFHYSVDMWLGLVLVCLLWRAMSWVEFPSRAPGTGSVSAVPGTASPKPSQPPPARFAPCVSRRDAVWYGVPALVAYLQATGLVLPRAWSNAMIVAYVAAGAAGFARSSAGQRARSRDGGAGAAPSPDIRHEDTGGARHQSSIHYAQHLLLCAAFLTLVTYL
jgi:hypothetical protein